MFLVYPNYKNILYYNCSSYYAISILSLNVHPLVSEIVTVCHKAFGNALTAVSAQRLYAVSPTSPNPLIPKGALSHW